MLNSYLSQFNLPQGMRTREVGPILLVDGDPGLRQSRAALLLGFNIPVKQIAGYTDVCELSESSSFSLVVINLAPAQEEAGKIAEYVRRHWPEAKILLLGRLSIDFDDPLYDDIVDARFNPSAFVSMTERLLTALGATLPVRHDS
jgi:hypothetical protein